MIELREIEVEDRQIARFVQEDVDVVDAFRMEANRVHDLSEVLVVRQGDRREGRLFRHARVRLHTKPI